MRYRCTIATIIVAGLSLVALGQPSANDRDRPKRPGIADQEVKEPMVARLSPSVQTSPDPSKAAGTIVYDTGTVSGFVAASGWTVGNHFDTAAGSPVLAPGTVTRFTYFVLSLGGYANGYLTVYDNPTTGGAAPMLTWTSLTPLVGSWNTVTLSVNYTGPAFLAGLYNWVTATTTANGETCGLDSGAVGGQGYHAMAINWGSPSGSGFTTLGSYNALLRASGNILVPVELMEFEVE